MSNELVTVLMPVLNGELFIEKSILSIVNQTIQSHICIIDNGSTDRTIEIVLNLSNIYPQIEILHESKKGISNALNCGLKNSKTKYIARLDSDDLMEPLRLERQLDFLENHMNYALVGSQIEFIDSNGNASGISKYPVSSKLIDFSLNFKNPLAHPSVMFNRTYALEAGSYDHKFDGAEDLDLWLRLRKFGKFGNINIPLTKYRLHQYQVSSQNNLYKNELDVRYKQLRSNVISLKLIAVILNILRITDLILIINNVFFHRKIFNKSWIAH